MRTRATSDGERQRLRARYAACIAVGLGEEAEALAGQLGVRAGEVAAHRRAGHHALDEWEPEEFDQFAALPPGRFDKRVFDQTTWWVDILRRPRRITDPDDFTDAHLLAVLAFVQREAWRWADFPDLDGDDLVNVVWFLLESAHRIRCTPLFEALTAEAKRRGLLGCSGPERGEEEQGMPPGHPKDGE